MLPKYQKQLSGRSRGIPLGDPVARRTEWDPMKPRAWHIRGRKFIAVSDDRRQFRPTIMALVLGALLLILGAIMLFVLVGAVKAHWSMFWVTDAVVPLAAFGALGVGLFVLYRFISPIVFDKELGYFWHGPLNPRRRPPHPRSDWAAKLDQVHAVQVLPKYRQGTEKADGAYYGCELNLILHNARRVHVVDHNNYARLSADAAELARFLDVPLWDGS